MKTINLIIGKISAFIILSVICFSSVLPGIFAANFIVEKFNLTGFYCLFGIIPLFAVSFVTILFITSGIKYIIRYANY